MDRDRFPRGTRDPGLYAEKPKGLHYVDRDSAPTSEQAEPLTPPWFVDFPLVDGEPCRVRAREVTLIKGIEGGAVVRTVNQFGQDTYYSKMSARDLKLAHNAALSYEIEHAA